MYNLKANQKVFWHFVIRENNYVSMVIPSRHHLKICSNDREEENFMFSYENIPETLHMLKTIW